MNNKDWFELDEKGIVQLRKEARNIPELKELYSSKDSSKYWQYIWHSCSHKSPYSAFDENERAEKVQNDFLQSQASNTLLKAAEAYRDTLETVSMRLLRSCKKAAIGIQVYLEQQAKKGITEENIDQVIKALEKVGKIIESLDKLEERVKKEITNDEKIRGGGDIKSRER